MYHGNIVAEYQSLEKNKLIEMKWRMLDWETFSHVIIEIEDGDDVRYREKANFL